MLIAAERERPDVAARREDLKREQPLLNPDRLVFIDETWAKTNMTRPRGRSPRGERLLASVPHGHWKTTMVLAALRTTGLTAPLVVDGAIKGEIFLGWARHHLVPTLHSGDVVVMDNLGVMLTHLGEPLEPPPLAPARGPPTDWGELLQMHDDRDGSQSSPDELPAIDVHSL